MHIRSFVFNINIPATLSDGDHAPRILRFIEARTAHMEWSKDVIMYGLIEWFTRDLLSHIAKDPDSCVGIHRCREGRVGWMALGEALEEFCGRIRLSLRKEGRWKTRRIMTHLPCLEHPLCEPSLPQVGTSEEFSAGSPS